METELIASLRAKSLKIKLPDKILLILLSGLGDTLMFTPAIRLLRLACPRSWITALTMRQSEYDLLHTLPDLNEVRIWPFQKKNPLSSFFFLRKLRKERFDLSILPCPSNRIHYNVIAALSGARERAGFHYLKQSRWNLDFLNHVLLPHQDHVHNVEHNLLLVEYLTRFKRTNYPQWNPELTLQTIPYDDEQASLFLKSSGLEDQSFIALHISSSRAKHMERKCWPREKFLQLVQNLRDRLPELHFLILCGDEDLEDSQWLAEQIKNKVHLARGIPIRTLAQIFLKCRLFITNDSGLFHVGMAKKIPTLVLFGPTNPKRTGPWISPAEVIHSDLPCRPCFYHTSHELKCPAGLNFKCIRDLPVEQVFQAASKILGIS